MMIICDLTLMITIILYSGVLAIYTCIDRIICSVWLDQFGPPAPNSYFVKELRSYEIFVENLLNGIII
jgi:hypothetical protein